MAFFRICSICGVNDMPTTTQSILRNASEDAGVIFETFAKNVSALVKCTQFPPDYFEKSADNTGGIIQQHVCKGCRPKLESHLETYGLWRQLERDLKGKTEDILNLMRGMDDQQIATLNAYQTMVKNTERGDGKPLDVKKFGQELFQKMTGTSPNPKVEGEETGNVGLMSIYTPPGPAPQLPSATASASIPLQQRATAPAASYRLLGPLITPVCSPTQVAIKEELTDYSSGPEEASSSGSGGEGMNKRKVSPTHAGAILLFPAKKHVVCCKWCPRKFNSMPDLETHSLEAHLDTVLQKETAGKVDARKGRGSTPKRGGK